MRKKIWIVCGIVLLFGWCRLPEADAQSFTIKKFSSNTDSTVAEMTAFLRSVSKSYNKDADTLVQYFSDHWPEWSQSQQQSFLDISNLMLKKRMKPFPHFKAFIHTCQALADMVPNKSQEEGFMKSVRYFVANEANQFANLMGRYEKVMRDRELNTFTSSVHWYARNSMDFLFECDSVPSIRFPYLDLVGSNGKDSVIIRQTNGRFYPTTLRFAGAEGVVDWIRAGLAPNEIYVEIKSYNIILKAPNIEIENVLYYDFRYFEKPQLGKLEDKAINTQLTEEGATYPRFTSYDKNIRIHNLYEDVDYLGGVFVRGNRFLGQGTPDHLANLIFYKNGNMVLWARSTSFLLKKENVESSLCAASLYVGEEDSIYHSAVQLRYKAQNRDLWLIRGKDGSMRMPFFNTYHQLEMYEESIHWQMTTESADFTSLPGTVEAQSSVFESANFFEAGRTDKFRGMSEINPMYTLYEFFRQNHVRQGSLDDIVEYFRYSRDDVRSLLFRFAEGGFIDYNMLTDIITYKQKLGNYLLNETKKKDYDILQFRSQVAGGKPNATLSFLNRDLVIYGLDMIIVSDTQIVTVFPTGKKITMQKNRDFLFHGKVEAGLFDFWVTNCKFSYEHFNFDFVVIDSMVFYVEDKTMQPNMRGEYPLKRVRSYVEDINGVLYVDEPNNKSGTLPMPKYPYFESRLPGRVYYDHEYVYNKVYDRNRFYFVVEPFTITHLDDYSTDSLLFNGYLYSDGIFPELHKSLKVRPDFSLGFVYETESDGLPAYNGTGNFTGKIDLSNRGLRCTGSVDYLVSHGEGKEMLFFLDSMRARFDTYVVSAQSGGTEYPPISVKNANALWLPYQDVMRLENEKAPFLAFEDATLDGVLTVSSRGVRAGGLMKYRNAEMQSDDYQYLHHEMKSDALSFRLKDSLTDSYFIEALNHQAHLDFSVPHGHFVSNTGREQVKLPINQFYTYAKEFDWLVNDEKLAFKYEDPYAEVDIPSTPIKDLYAMKSEGNELVSMRPDQKGLQFTTTRAEYDMRHYEILAEGVRFIEVADAALFPNKGLVKIKKEGFLEPLDEAKILANTETQYHEIFHVHANIASKNWYNAYGDYNYVDENEEKHEIHLDSVWSAHNGLTRGIGNIAREASFTLNPHFGFYGKVTLYAENEFLEFKGGVSPIHGCDTVMYSAIKYKGEINPKDVTIPIDSTTHDMSNRRVSAAIASNTKTGKVFTAFARAKEPINSPEYVSAQGLLVYDKEKEAFLVASRERLDDESAGGNIMMLDGNSCVSRGEGILNLGTKFGRMTFTPVGSVVHYMQQDSAAISLSAALDFYFNEESMKIMYNTMANASDLSAIDIVDNTNYQNALLTLLGSSEFRRNYPELVQYNSFRRLPRALAISFMFSDLTFEWNQATKAFVSKGDIGIAVCGKKELNRYVPGLIEIQKKSNQSILQMYFEIGDEWFFFRYYGTAMQGLSSNADFNKAVKETDPKKKILSAEKGQSAYHYTIGQLGVKKKFLRLHNWETESSAEE